MTPVRGFVKYKTADLDTMDLYKKISKEISEILNFGKMVPLVVRRFVHTLQVVPQLVNQAMVLIKIVFSQVKIFF